LQQCGRVCAGCLLPPCARQHVPFVLLQVAD
jgi:hypothetical protein